MQVNKRNANVSAYIVIDEIKHVYFVIWMIRVWELHGDIFRFSQWKCNVIRRFVVFRKSVERMHEKRQTYSVLKGINIIFDAPK